MATGDHVYVYRFGGLYSHHGIDVGAGEVIHYSGDDWRSSRVRQSPRDEFAMGSTVHVRSYEGFHRIASLEDLVIRQTSRRIQALDEWLRGHEKADGDSTPRATIARAESRLGQGGFDFAFNNCEHFATWCKTGIRSSRQIEEIWKFTLNPPRYAWARVGSWLTASFDGSSRPPGRRV